MGAARESLNGTTTVTDALRPAWGMRETVVPARGRTAVWRRSSARQPLGFGRREGRFAVEAPEPRKRLGCRRGSKSVKYYTFLYVTTTELASRATAPREVNHVSDGPRG